MYMYIYVSFSNQYATQQTQIFSKEIAFFSINICVLSEYSVELC